MGAPVRSNSQFRDGSLGSVIAYAARQNWCRVRRSRSRRRAPATLCLPAGDFLDSIAAPRCAGSNPVSRLGGSSDPAGLIVFNQPSGCNEQAPPILAAAQLSGCATPPQKAPHPFNDCSHSGDLFEPTACIDHAAEVELVEIQDIGVYSAKYSDPHIRYGCEERVAIRKAEAAKPPPTNGEVAQGIALTVLSVAAGAYVDAQLAPAPSPKMHVPRVQAPNLSEIVPRPPSPPSLWSCAEPIRRSLPAPRRARAHTPGRDAATQRYRRHT